MTSNLLAEMQRDGFGGKRRSTTRGGEWQGPCILPSCGGQGRDRLRVQPNAGNYGYFECRVCNTKGSLIDYLVIKRGCSKQQALREAGWKPRDGSEPKFIVPRNILAGEIHPTHEAPCEAWQTSAKAFVKYCVENLWNEQGEEALDYLRGRGLKDETIKHAQLGYNPAELRQSGPKWGRKQHGLLWQGIVIPWFIGEDLWRLTIRDEKAEGNDRYKQVAGGSNGLYLGYLLGYDRPAIVVEGEFDALSIAQEAGHHVSVVATGSTEGSHTARWIASLVRKDMVLIAFDAEGKGDKAAQWWLDRLENAHRLRPWWADANQMLQDGIDLLNDWILPRMESIIYGSSVLSEIGIDTTEKCYGCQCPFPSFEGWDIEQIPADDMAAIDPADGQMYCEKCRPDLFNEGSTPSQPCAEEQFTAYVQEIASAIPGSCTVTMQVPGYTLKQRVAELEAEAKERQREAQYERIRRSRQYNSKIATIA